MITIQQKATTKKEIKKRKRKLVAKQTLLTFQDDKQLEN